jgi:hypothetical protein
VGYDITDGHDDEQMRIGGVSRISSWQDTGRFNATQKHFVAFVDQSLMLVTWTLLKCFKSFSDIVVMQHIVEETKEYAQEQIEKSITPFTFHSRIRKWQDVTVDEMYVVLALFMLMGILQKPT